jgi:hypothetical protein
LVWWPGDEREGGFHLMVEFESHFFDESAGGEPPCALSNKEAYVNKNQFVCSILSVI